MKYAVTAAMSLLLSGAAFAAPLTLTPADPQPDAGDLAPGLAVSYAYGAGGRTLQEAESKLKRASPGKPLQGFSYMNTNEGDKTLTSDEAYKVAAAISGYIRFDTAGTYEVEFVSNDGLVASIGGQQVALFDGVHGCESAGVQEVEVPVAGWYELSATYFQRKGSACLLMDWNVGGGMGPVPDSVFGHIQ